MKSFLKQSILFFIIFTGVYFVYTIMYASSTEGLPIWQGHTSSHRTSISILTTKSSQLRYYFIKKISLIPSLSDVKKTGRRVYPIHQASRPFSEWIVDHIVFFDLQKNQKYWLVVIDPTGNMLDYRQFETRDLDVNSFKVAVASCLDDSWEKKEQEGIWTDLLEFNPDMLFLLGDNVYADKQIEAPTEKNFWNRYVQTFRTLGLYKTRNLVPILAVWDDHDYGKNNGGEEFHLKSQMQVLFRDFFYLDFDSYLQKGEGISFSLKTPHQNFIFMDTRSFRSNVKDKYTGSLWGKLQEEKLLQQLNESQKPSWILNGMQIFGRHHKFESYETNFPINFNQMMTQIQQAQSPVFFISGDRHVAELLKIHSWSYPAYELTTSPIHARTYPANTEAVDSRLLYSTSKLNFAIISSTARGRGLKVDLHIYGLKKQILFSENLSIIKE